LYPWPAFQIQLTGFELTDDLLDVRGNSLGNAAAAKSVWSLAAKSLFFGMTCDAAQLSDVEL
jgi:hypothetical protein